MSWHRELLSDSRNVVRRLLLEPLLDVASLQEEVRRYRDQVRGRARPTTDVATAVALSDATLDLLVSKAAARKRDRRMAQVAARYFALAGEDDLSSPFGFDDDVEVFNAVVTALGEPERALAY